MTEEALHRDLVPIRLVLELAARMEVRLVEAEWQDDEDGSLFGELGRSVYPRAPPWRPRPVHLPDGVDPAKLTDGPCGWTWAGHGIVVAEPGYRFRLQGADDWRYILHEISHAVWTPPGHSPDQVTSECVGQDQWERAVVKAVFPFRYWKEHREFQGESSRPFGRKDEFGMRQVKDEGQYKDHRRLASWREGVALCRAVGAVNESGRPTWKRPDYDELVRLGGGLQ